MSDDLCETVRYLITHPEDETSRDDATRSLYHEKKKSLSKKQFSHLKQASKDKLDIESVISFVIGEVDSRYQAPEAYFDVIQHKTSGAPDEYKFSSVKMAHDLIANEHFIVIGDERGEKSYLYHAEDSVYRPDGENRIKAKIKVILGEMAGIPSKQQILEVIDKVRRLSIRWKIEIRDNVEEIPLLNGVLNWRINQLRLYDLDKDIFFCQIPQIFNPDAKSPAIEKFFDDIVENDTRQTLIDIIALALYRKPMKEHWGVIGPTDSAKTTYGLLLKVFFGAENIATISIQRLTSSPFASAGLEHKMLNMYDDLGQRKLASLGDWNAMTGGGSVTKERKGVDLTSFDPYATHLYLANKMPKLDPNDPLDAFFRRMHMVKFPFVFKDNPTEGTNEKKKINDLIETLTTPEELSGLLNLVIERMPEVVDKGPHIPKDATESMIEYMQSSNPFQAFVIEYCQLDRSMMTSKELMREMASWYCEENGVQQSSNKDIKDVMNASGVTEYQEPANKEGKPRLRYWKGIKINPVMFGKTEKSKIEEGTRKSQEKEGKSQEENRKSQDSQKHQSQLSQDFPTYARGDNESSIIEGDRKNPVIPVSACDSGKRVSLPEALEMIKVTFEIQRCDLSMDSLKDLLPWVDIEGYESELTRRGIWSKKPGPEGLILFHWEGVRA